MSGYIGSKTSVTQVDGYNRTEAEAEFVQDPNGAITVSGSNVGIGTSSPSQSLHISSTSPQIRLQDTDASGTPYSKISGASGNIYIQADDANEIADSKIDFRVDGSQRMVIDSSGNVGIGSSDPRGHLDIAAAQNTAKFASPHLALTATGTTNNTGFTGVSYAVSSITNYGWTAGALRATSGNNSSFVFTQHNNSSVGIERMRIDGSGNLLLGTTARNGVAVSSLTFNGSAAHGIGIKTTGPTGSAFQVFYNSAGTAVGSISQNGGSGTGYNTSSDYRLKTDAQPMTGASARVQSLNPVNFEWISDGTRVDGFLAHEAQAVVPEAVSGTQDAMKDEEYEVTAAVEATYDDDGNELTAAVDAVMGTRSVPDYQGIDQSKLVPLLTAALQEALTKIDDMETRLAALEAV